jgi:FAD synthase
LIARLVFLFLYKRKFIQNTNKQIEMNKFDFTHSLTYTKVKRVDWRSRIMKMIHYNGNERAADFILTHFT